MTGKTLGALLLFSLAGGAAASAAPSQSGTAVAVTIRDHAFVPSVIHVKAGRQIVWTNADQDPHTVTSGPNNVDDNKWTSSALIADGESFKLRLLRPGTYHYFCKPHQFETSMHGTIVVTK